MVFVGWRDNGVVTYGSRFDAVDGRVVEFDAASVEQLRRSLLGWTAVPAPSNRVGRPVNRLRRRRPAAVLIDASDAAQAARLKAAYRDYMLNGAQNRSYRTFGR